MAKQFISKINLERLREGNEMVVIDLGWKKFVMDKHKALALIECLESAELYEEKWWSDEDRKRIGMGNDSYTYHVYPNTNNFSMSIMSDEKYRMCKLAGKPEEK
jgi:hypothetical protein